MTTAFPLSPVSPILAAFPTSPTPPTPTLAAPPVSSSKSALAPEKVKDYSVPLRFGIVEPGVYRSNTPDASNITFLRTLSLSTVISLTPETPHPAVAQFYADSNIAFMHLGMTLWQPCQTRGWRPISDDLVKQSLEMLLQRKEEGPGRGGVMLVDPSGIHLTGIVVGCLRKLQHWSFASILVEYRAFSGPVKSRYSDEQYIELYDTDLVNIPPEPRSWFTEGERMWREEEEEEEEREGVTRRERSGRL